jgi:hypothetical protein
MLHKAVEKTFDVSSWFTLFNFVGTYKPILASVVASKGYLVLGDGSLHPMDSNSTPLKSYRWYLRVTDRNGNDKQVNAVRLHILDDGEETDIGMLTADNDSGQQVVYDLSGRRISNGQQPKANSQCSMFKAAIEREATEAFRVATECGCGLTKGSESPLTTEASDARINSPEREQARRAASMFNGLKKGIYIINGKKIYVK